MRGLVPEGRAGVSARRGPGQRQSGARRPGPEPRHRVQRAGGEGVRAQARPAMQHFSLEPGGQQPAGRRLGQAPSRLLRPHLGHQQQVRPGGRRRRREDPPPVRGVGLERGGDQAAVRVGPERRLPVPLLAAPGPQAAVGRHAPEPRHL